MVKGGRKETGMGWGEAKRGSVLLRFFCRMLLAHFMKRVSSSVGGHKDCCDNCRQRYKCSVV